MPYRPRTRVTRALPTVVAALSAFAAAATITGVSAAAPPGPAPNPGKINIKQLDPKLSHRISAVNAQLDRLRRRNDQLDEQYNVAAAGVAAARRTATKARREADRALAHYRAAHARFLQAVTQQYESGSSPTIGNMLTSAAPQQYVDGLTLANYLSRAFATTVHADRAARANAARASRRAAAALGAARTKEAALAKRRSALRQHSQRFQQVLATLTARQRRERAHAEAVAAAKARAELVAQRARQAWQARQARQTLAQPSAASAPSRRPAPAPVARRVSRAVRRVIAFAQAQIGKPYRYGGSGPNAYDCSGLTMASWARAGVHLPHSAAEQYNYGTHVSYRQLRPGDLIFLYSPIGHVELYVGHDLAVSAADPAIGIVYVHPSQDLADFTGATRLRG